MHSRDARLGRGFSLLEMVAVIAIKAMVMVVVGRGVLRQLERAKVETTKLRMNSLDHALVMFELEHRRLPTTADGLDALVDDPTRIDGRGYLSDPDAVNDAWATPFAYASPRTHRPRDYDLASFGADRRPGGKGAAADITNWSAYE